MTRSEAIRAAFRKLYGPRDRKIVEAIMAGKSQAETARDFNLTRQRVWQIVRLHTAGNGPKSEGA